MLKHFEYLYLVSGGDPEFLIQGINSTINNNKLKKLAGLSTLVNKLCYSCWSISEEDIENLLTNNSNNEENWLTKELILAVLIIINVQKLSLIVEAFGLSKYYYTSNEFKYLFGFNYKNNISFNLKDKTSKDIKENPDKDDIQKIKEEKILEIKNNLDQIENTSKSDSVNGNEKGKRESSCNSTNSKKIKDNVLYDSYFDDPKLLHKNNITVFKKEEEILLNPTTFMPNFLNKDIQDIFAIYISNQNRKYFDFDPSDTDYASNFDFNWDEHGYHILKEYDSDLIESVFEETNFCFSMTFNSLGHLKDVRTKPIRFAMSTYIEKIFGLEREDYDYSHVNKLISRNDKTFMKYVVCYPEKIDDTMINSITYKSDEVLHLILLVSNAKLCTQLRFFSQLFYSVMNKSKD